MDWHLVFRAVSGVPDPDPYDLWVSDLSFNDNIPEAQELTNKFKGHYKSKTALLWDKLDIFEVWKHILCNSWAEKLKFRNVN